MFIFVIVEIPFIHKVSNRLPLSDKKGDIGFLVRIAKEMSRQLREWLGKYVTDGKIEINNIERNSLVSGHASKYRIVKPLDRGAMATVFEAEDIQTGRQVVLKAMNGLQEKVVVRRFIREARILASLNHPNIVSVYDLSNEIQMPFIVMEPLTNSANEKTNSNFKYLAKQFHNGEIDLRTMLYYIADISEALDYLHTHPEGPIIHRDLKPSNILFSKEKARGSGPERFTIKLVDFGLSRIAGGSLTTLTNFQQVLGTPEYSPLQDMYNAEGENRTEERLDVYSLGVITYFAITNGLLPFRVDNNLLKRPQSGSPISSPLGHKSDTPIAPTNTRADTSKEIAQREKNQMWTMTKDDNLTVYYSNLDILSNTNPIMTLIKMHSEAQADFSIARSDIPSALIELTKRMLAKHPKDRPHAREVTQEIRRIADLGKNLYLPPAILQE